MFAVDLRPDTGGLDFEKSSMEDGGLDDLAKQLACAATKGSSPEPGTDAEANALAVSFAAASRLSQHPGILP